jgi:glutathione S-transferase
MGNTFDVLNSSLTSTLRWWRGTNARGSAKQPAKHLKLYEFEACPYCRLVREALTELDLDALIYPAPHGGKRFRPQVAELGGKQQFPFLVDPNTGESMYESDAIIDYLYRRYRGRTGKVQVSYLVDPNTGSELFESEAIRDYLLATYAK